MKPFESDDDLERALFALPLEEPPAGMRESILAATAYGVRAPLPVKAWEVWGLGALCAILVWLLLAVARGGAAPLLAPFAAELDRMVDVVAQPQTLFWIALGGAAALWISQLNLTIAPEASRASRR